MSEIIIDVKHDLQAIAQFAAVCGGIAEAQGDLSAGNLLAVKHMIDLEITRLGAVCGAGD
ncbi:MAG: hypothetical protein LIO51_04660 [Clostridiales bacterium]|nr:hypothetical protein [Clostridiales bacterium]